MCIVEQVAIIILQYRLGEKKKKKKPDRVYLRPCDNIYLQASLNERAKTMMYYSS